MAVFKWPVIFTSSRPLEVLFRINQETRLFVFPRCTRRRPLLVADAIPVRIVNEMPRLFADHFSLS